jgi:GntR family transcriptional repressor for pyruvate dehydrogenase complex
MTIPIRSVTITEAIVESLKDRFRNGEFRPGDQLPSEQMMLQEYHVSRLTLREALARLAALGIIRVQHGKGAFLKDSISVAALNNVLIPLFPQYDINRMNDLVEARNLIESEIAAKAAESRTEEQITEIESLLAYDAEVFNNAERFAKRDYAFHLALAHMAGNQFFLAMYQALYHQIQTFLVQYAQSIDNREEAMERHRPILQAIIDQDSQTARQLAREHAGICASFIKNVVNKKGPYR